MTTTASGAAVGLRDEPGTAGSIGPRSISSWIWATAIAVAAVPFVAEAWFVLRAPQATLVTTMPDDAFYYLEIGQRAARGEGFTFDGVHQTSGYHPLWQWLVTVVDWVVPGETLQVRAVRLLGLAILALAFVVTTRVIWRSVGPLPALGGLLLASHSVGSIRAISGGMETPVVLLALALCFAALQRYFAAPSRRHAFYLGLASALLVLSRLDMAIALPLLAAAVLTTRPRMRNLSGWLAGGALLGVPYGLYHLAVHGSVLTTSAIVKQYWVDDHIAGLGGWFGPGHLGELRLLLRRYVESIADHLQDGPTAFSAIAGLTLVGLAMIGAGLGVRRLRQRGGRLGPTGTAGAWMTALAVGKLGFDLVFVPLWVLVWYAAAGQTTALWLIGCAAGAGLQWMVNSCSVRLWVPVAAIACLALLPSGLALVTTESPPRLAWQMELNRAADWLTDNQPEGTYGAFDAGLIGYRADGVRPVENLDGLVNDPDFARYLSTRPTGYDVVQREHIDILINDLPVEARESEWSCAVTLWEGDRSVSSTDPDRPDRIYVLDVRACD